MNKDELTKEDILNATGGILDYMLDYADNSQKEIDKLYEKIDKAIGHIYACGCELSKDECRYLLEILGENNE